MADPVAVELEFFPGVEARRPVVPVGQTLRLHIGFRGEDGALAAASSRLLTLRRPDGNTVVLPAESWVLDADGRYHVDVTPDIAGAWAVRAETSSPAPAVAERRFAAQSSQVVPPDPGAVLVTEDLDLVVTQVGEPLRAKRIPQLPAAAGGALELLASQAGEAVRLTVPDPALLGIGLVGVTSIADLRARATAGLTSGTPIMVRGYYADADGGGGLFLWNAASALADDGGMVIKPASVGAGAGRWIRFVLSGTPLHARWFGAKFDLAADYVNWVTATDDYAALAAALSAAAARRGALVLPSAAAKVSAGLTASSYVSLVGEAMYPGNGPSGTQLVFALATPVCLTMGGSGTNAPTNLGWLVVGRQPGTVPAGSIGLLWQEGYNHTFSTILSRGHAINYKAKAVGSGGLGISGERMFSAACTDCHLELDSWPEFRVDRLRFGQNGGGETAGVTHIRITGGQAPPAADGGIGPNTVRIQSGQFNGSATAARLLDFKSQLGGGQTAKLFDFAGCHFENFTSYIGSDAGTSEIYGLRFSQCTFNDPAAQLFALDAATKLSEFAIMGCIVSGPVVYAPPVGKAPNNFRINGSRLRAGLSLTGQSGATVNLSGNNYGGNVTLAGFFSQLTMVGGEFTSGNVVDSATGSVIIQTPTYTRPPTATAAEIQVLPGTTALTGGANQVLGEFRVLPIGSTLDFSAWSWRADDGTAAANITATFTVDRWTGSSWSLGVATASAAGTSSGSFTGATLNPAAGDRFRVRLTAGSIPAAVFVGVACNTR